MHKSRGRACVNRKKNYANHCNAKIQEVRRNCHNLDEFSCIVLVTVQIVYELKEFMSPNFVLGQTSRDLIPRNYIDIPSKRYNQVFNSMAYNIFLTFILFEFSIVVVKFRNIRRWCGF